MCEIIPDRTLLIKRMKSNCLLPHGYHLGALGLALSVALLFCASASAQVNLLKNGNFESAPIGVGPTTNWSVLYLKGCPDDFEIKDRTRSASNGSSSTKWYGGMFRPRTQKPIHACFTQTVTSLTQNHPYSVNGSMWMERADKNQVIVYIEAIGGRGNLQPDGRRSLFLTNVVDGTFYAYGKLTSQSAPIFEGYSEIQTPDASGKIEVRLHYWAQTFRTYDKMWQEATYFDDITLYN
jgi:hypothetical protein